MTGTRARHKAGRHWRGWLRKAGRGAQKCAGAVGRWWRDANTNDDELLDRWAAQFKPITGRTDVSFPRLLVAQVTGKPRAEVAW